MNRLAKSLLIGCVAGIVDVVPMLIMELPWRETGSAFIHWLGLGFIITHVSLSTAPWLKGVIIAVLAAIPILILISGQGFEAMGPIMVSSVILGAGVGWATGRWCG